MSLSLLQPEEWVVSPLSQARMWFRDPRPPSPPQQHPLGASLKVRVEVAFTQELEGQG